MLTMIKTEAVPRQQDSVNDRLHELSQAAMTRLDVAEQDAKTREALCLSKSPHMCLVVKFGDSLMVHPHVLLAALSMSKLRFKFDISKLAMDLPETTRAIISEALCDDGVRYSEHDLYIDLREPLLPLERASLVFTLAHLNGIIDVHVHKIFVVDYSAIEVARLLR